MKLFLFMTKDVEVYEQTKITARQGKRLDIESAYIDAGQVIEDDKPCEKRYIHVFSEAGFPEITKPDILEIRKYMNISLLTRFVVFDHLSCIDIGTFDIQTFPLSCSDH